MPTKTKPAHPNTPAPRGREDKPVAKLPQCVVCGTQAGKDTEPITSRLTTEDLEIVHVRCVGQLPAADGQWGYHYPAGSVDAVR